MRATSVSVITPGRSSATSFTRHTSTVLTVLSVAALVAVARPVLQWSVLAAHWGGIDHADCTAGGACWNFVRLRLPLLVYGHYPEAERWRVTLAGASLMAFAVPVLRQGRHRGQFLAALLLLFPALAAPAGGRRARAAGGRP